MASLTYEHDGDGGKLIPATQRPDGTWRKPRRVRAGYVPQEEVPLYESKGKQFAARRSAHSNLPVGLPPELAAAMLTQESDKSNKKKKKKKGPDEIVEKVSKMSITEPVFSKPAPAAPAPISDPAKRLKNLKKKLRDIETLEEKLKSGELSKPDKDQLDKISKKDQVIIEIAELEITC